VIDDAVGRDWYGASTNEQHALGACIGSFQGHVISLSPHGWHLSRNLRTFVARLVVISPSPPLYLGGGMGGAAGGRASCSR
jgi:hypothetical protein